MPLIDRSVFLLIFTVLALALSVHHGFVPLPLGTLSASDISTRFLSLTLIALAIERAVEIYIANRFSNDPDDCPATLRHRKRRAAATASLVMSLAICVLGVRVLAQLAPPTGLTALQQQGFHLVDIILTALLLSGGADGMHQLLNRAIGERRRG